LFKLFAYDILENANQYMEYLKKRSRKPQNEKEGRKREGRKGNNGEQEHLLIFTPS
jgi:hypothetical protein